uniref:DOCKER domain-containing protein n=1 Tax=Toxocara canis TaxID=6265 RepID=A0A183V9F0_TOXCA
LQRYYDKIGQPDLYINYVYKLYDLHMLSNNKVEAAFTLLKHAETLKVMWLILSVSARLEAHREKTWTDGELPMALLDAHLNRHCATQRQLKEALYVEMANLFDEKDMWEEAIAILKELVPEYEKNYEFEKLPPLLVRRAYIVDDGTCFFSYIIDVMNSHVDFVYSDQLMVKVFSPFSSPAPRWEHLEMKLAIIVASLHQQCKSVVFAFSRLSFFWRRGLFQRRLAELYHKVSTQGRVGCTYYLVGFFGSDFPSYLNGQQFVYRGNECEVICQSAISSFQHRLLSTFPGSELVTSMDDCSHLSAATGKHLQIFPVQPISDLFFEKKNVSRLIRWYYKNNRVRVECSPLMEAVSTMRKNNIEMEEMANVVLSTPLESVVPLGGKIRGIVQAFVQGGIKNYNVCVAFITAKKSGGASMLVTDDSLAGNMFERVPCLQPVSVPYLVQVRTTRNGGSGNLRMGYMLMIFFTDECDAVLTAEEKELVRQLQRLIKEQVPILEFCLYVHASRDHQVDANFHESLISSFKEYKHNIEARFGKIPSRLPPSCSIHLPSHPKAPEDRSRSGFDTLTSPSVMSITGVFRRGGGLYTTKSGRSTPRKSLGMRSDSKGALENGLPKRVSSSSDRSLDSMSNTEVASSAPRSTMDLSRIESSLQSPLSLSSCALNDDTLRPPRTPRRPSECVLGPPPLPPRRLPPPLA